MNFDFIIRYKTSTCILLKITITVIQRGQRVEVSYENSNVQKPNNILCASVNKVYGDCEDRNNPDESGTKLISDEVLEACQELLTNEDLSDLEVSRLEYHVRHMTKSN